MKNSPVSLQTCIRLLRAADFDDPALAAERDAALKRWNSRDRRKVKPPPRHPYEKKPGPGWVRVGTLPHGTQVYRPQNPLRYTLTYTADGPRLIVKGGRTLSVRRNEWVQRA